MRVAPGQWEVRVGSASRQMADLSVLSLTVKLLSGSHHRMWNGELGWVAAGKDGPDHRLGLRTVPAYDVV